MKEKQRNLALTLYFLKKMTEAAASATKDLVLQENKTVVDEGMGTTRLVTKLDGTKVPFSEEKLRTSLNAQLDGLNIEFINIDIIMTKVSSGLYNGKSMLHSDVAYELPLVASSSFAQFCDSAKMSSFERNFLHI